jgi:hypothetical protein
MDGIFVIIGIILLILDIWLILKFLDIANDADDIRNILIDIRRKSEFPHNDISKIPTYGNEVDQNGKEYFRIVRMNEQDNLYIGSFNGFISLDKNSGDRHDIAVYDDDKVKLGYVSRGNKPLCDLLTSKDNTMKIHGFIDIRSEVKYYIGYFYLE